MPIVRRNAAVRPFAAGRVKRCGTARKALALTIVSHYGHTDDIFTAFSFEGLRSPV